MANLPFYSPTAKGYDTGTYIPNGPKSPALFFATQDEGYPLLSNQFSEVFTAPCVGFTRFSVRLHAVSMDPSLIAALGFYELTTQVRGITQFQGVGILNIFTDPVHTFTDFCDTIELRARLTAPILAGGVGIRLKTNVIIEAY